ncbi:MAG: hypothetical protein JW882_17720 [Deltaproteobacteria bacterium]|nr:hypothetical protein [Deltaproteobacteria bacterium]
MKINLSNEKNTRLSTYDYSTRLLGGRGIAAKIYWDEVSPEVRAFDPENYLIFITGPLAGFTRFAGSRWQLCGKSPEMEPESFSYANFGGSWGAWLKFAGYDGLVVTGKAERPVYVYMDERDTVEIRDASFLWGKTTVETQAALKERLGKTVKTVQIGPAAENLVLFSTILAEDNSSGSSGFGSVMGSKNLKAIAIKVDERKKPVAADPDMLNLLGKEVLKLKKENDESGHQKTLIGDLTACFGCINGCSRRTYRAENNESFKSFCQATKYYLDAAMKYSRNILPGSVSDEYGAAMKDNKDIGEVCRLATRLCDKYGLDTIVMEGLLEWIDKCHEAGILTEEETGLPLSRIGSTGFIEELVRKITYREGFGDILAQGTIKAAEQIGRGAMKLISPGTATRASECKDYDSRLILANSLLYATEPRRPIQLLHAIAFPLRRWVWWRNQAYDDSFLSSDIFRDIAEKYWGGPVAADLSTYEGKALAAIKIQDYGYIRESAIFCDLAWPILQVHSPESHIRMGTVESRIISAVTGMDMGEQELLKTGERIFNLQRAVLMRQGWGGRAGDRLLDHLHEDPLEDNLYFSPGCIVPDKNGEAVSLKGSVVKRDEFENMKSEYYDLRGWDRETGFQTKEKLEDLDLHDIAEDLEMKGLLR